MNNRIRELRQDKNITQVELAKHIGVAQNTLSYWEQGRFGIDTSNLLKIADYFNVSIDYLLGRTSEIKSNNQSDLYLSDHEQALVFAYRAKPEMQNAVDTLLNIPSDASDIEDDIAFQIS